MKTKFISLNEADQSPVHIAIPKFLFKIRVEGKKLSCNAILVYALLLDRHALSFKNGWVNEKGEVYFVFKRRSIATIIKKTEHSVAKYMKELVKAGLIQEQIFDYMLPNRIYLTKTNDRGEVSRYTMSDSANTLQGGYAMLPKSIVDCKELTGEAKLLYAVLYNRTRLSVLNRKVNEKGNVYIRYARKELEEAISMSGHTLRKYIGELTDNGLLFEERKNRCQHSYLFLKQPVESDRTDITSSETQPNATDEKYCHSSTEPNSNDEINCPSTMKNTASREGQNITSNKKSDKSLFRKTDIEKVCQSKTNNQLDLLKTEVSEYQLLTETEKEVIFSLLDVIKIAINTNHTLYVSKQPVLRSDYEAVLARLDLSTLIDVLEAYKAAGSIRNQRAYVVSLVYQVVKEKPLKALKQSNKPQKANCSNIGNFPQREYSDDFYESLYEPFEDEKLSTDTVS